MKIGLSFQNNFGFMFSIAVSIFLSIFHCCCSFNNFSIRRNSGGNGLFKGGNGVVREIQFNQNMTAVILSNRRKVSPLGILDGENAKKGINILKTKNKKLKKLKSSESINIKKGDTIIIKTPGGGGYGKKATV